MITIFTYFLEMENDKVENGILLKENGFKFKNFQHSQLQVFTIGHLVLVAHMLLKK